MTGPTRLLERSRPAVRDLLRAGIAEEPSRRALQRTAAALGVSASVVSAAASASAGATLVAATPSALFIVGKWLAIGTLCGMGLAAGASTLTREAPRPAPTSQSAPTTRPLPAAVVVTDAPKVPLVVEEPVTTASATTRTRVGAGVPEQRSRPAPVAALPSSGDLPDAQSLAREVAAIDGARAAVTARDAATAARFLDDYASRPRTGTLEREAQLLRIDTLLLEGRTSEAQALAARYAAQYPHDARIARFGALLEKR